MSYGVKYRLEFSDETGIPKKLEILKKNYSGSVIDMIGGQYALDAVKSLKWLSLIHI